MILPTIPSAPDPDVEFSDEMTKRTAIRVRPMVRRRVGDLDALVLGLRGFGIAIGLREGDEDGLQRRCFCYLLIISVSQIIDT